MKQIHHIQCKHLIFGTNKLLLTCYDYYCTLLLNAFIVSCDMLRD